MKVRRTFEQPEGEMFIAYCPHTGVSYQCSDAIKLLQMVAEKLNDPGDYEWRIVKAAADSEGRAVMTDAQSVRWQENLPDPVVH